LWSLLGLLILLNVSYSGSLTTRWIGLTSYSFWDVPDNWYCGELNRTCTPQIGDDVIIHPSNSCSQCIRDIVIAPNSTAVCNTLQVIADSQEITLTVQGSLTIKSSAHFSKYTTVYVDFATVQLTDPKAQLTSEDSFVIDGGYLTGNYFNITFVNITSAATLENTVVKTLFITPASPELDTSLGGMSVNVTGTSEAYSSLILSGTGINVGRFTYRPKSDNYTLNFQGDISGAHLYIYGGLVTFQTGTGTFGNITLFNEVVFTILAATVSSASTDGDGTFYLAAGQSSLSATVYDIRTDFYATCGFLKLGGTICGNVLLEDYCGAPTLTTNDGFSINNLTTLYGSNLYGNGQLNVNLFNIESVNIFYSQVNIIKGINSNIYSPQIYLFNANFSLSSGTRFLQGGNFYIDGQNGLVINDGVWITNGNNRFLSISVPVAGRGTWIVNASYASLYAYGDTIYSQFIIQNGGRLTINGYNNVFNNISGDATSYVSLSGYTMTVNHITIGTLVDNVFSGFLLNDFDIKSYSGGGGDYKTFVKGTIGNFIGGSYTTLNIQPQVKILQGFSITSGDVLNSAISVPLGSFTFIGGYLNQTVNGGVFQVAGTTTFSSSFSKSFASNTILQTSNLICQCPSPDCGIPLSDWNHVQAGQTNGCII